MEAERSFVLESSSSVWRAERRLSISFIRSADDDAVETTIDDVTQQKPADSAFLPLVNNPIVDDLMTRYSH